MYHGICRKMCSIVIESEQNKQKQRKYVSLNPNGIKIFIDMTHIAVVVKTATNRDQNNIRTTKHWDQDQTKTLYFECQ